MNNALNHHPRPLNQVTLTFISGDMGDTMSFFHTMYEYLGLEMVGEGKWNLGLMPCWSSGQTRVYYHEPTTPLAHWPFRRQTAERPEVSLEVILMGWSRTQVSRLGSVWHPMCVSQPFLARETALSSLRRDAQFPLARNDSNLYRIAAPRATPNSVLRLLLNPRYHAPQLLCWCDIASLRYPTAATQRTYLTGFNLPDTVCKAILYCDT